MHEHNQPNQFDEIFAFLIIILISLFYLEPDFKYMHEAFQN